VVEKVQEMTRVFLRPDAATIKDNNGIGRVVHAQYRYLPKFDIELVGSEAQADVVAGHTHDYGASRIDACHAHGLYWSGDAGSGEYDNWHKEANKRIIESARRARVITVPSNWVAEPFKRDMRVAPVVIGHGIEFNEWTPGENDGYVLYGKNREGDVCTAKWALELAERKVKVVSTFAPKSMGEKPFHLTLTGELPADTMKEYLRRADVYLATTKETFGIQTLEALACGVPVLGFGWGGTADIVEHKHTGYLARPGDIDDLMRGLDYIRAHRLELSVNARAHASNYTWERVIGQYAQLYHQLAEQPEPTGVAVVIACHNYALWLGACLDSVLAQTYRVDEIIVVDDGSTDDSLRIAETYRSRGVKVIAQPNAGVAAARNNGVASTRQPLVVCLDADDLLDPQYVEACRDAMLRDRGLGIAFTGMSILKPGQPPSANVWTLSNGFDWEWQATPRNPPATHIPTGSMFRRAMWERAGGYKQQYAPGEDAEFYTRGLSVGFTARQVTDVPLYIYRDHGEGAHKRLPYKPIDEWMPWMRDREYPLAAPSEQAPNVRSYSDPKVSVIIPVGPEHGKFLPDALESLLGQTMREWEVIVVDDTENWQYMDDLRRFPFARMAATRKPESGPGAARNVGLHFAKAPLVLFLDADDQLAPTALAHMARLYGESEGRYIYGDWQAMGRDVVVSEGEYGPEHWLDFEDLRGKHSVTVLMATEDARRIKFDETLTGWEDWDFFARCALAGIQGRRLAQVTLYVRMHSSRRTVHVLENVPEYLDKMKAKFGGQAMAKSCCGGNADSLIAARRAWEGTPEEKGGGLSVNRTTKGRSSAPMDTNDPNAVMPVRMEFVGLRSGAVTYPGVRGGGRTYRGGRNAIDRYKNVHPADVATLEATGEWKRVAPAITEPQASPQAVPVAVPAVEMAVREPVLEMVAEVAPALEAAPVVEQVQVIQTADGPVKRKRGAGKTSKSTVLKDLPPLG
jgi:glycosyltransferase involved in cell wall biosynthesis